ncbi:MAG TPA: hypothetical protein VK879_21405 [Candidatus Sulfomarinibacteraceae bacterium]|nr:hypothetical protein [Candidatus Sulfomarinibacteraceae bacterium]
MRPIAAQLREDGKALGVELLQPFAQEDAKQGGVVGERDTAHQAR